MDSMSIIVTLALLGLSGVCWATKPELTIEPARAIKEGDTVTITCRVPISGPLDMSKIERSVQGQDYTITKKGNVEEYFRRTGRYEITHFDARAGEVRLTITGVTGADGGNIHCLHVNTGEFASENVVVHVPPKSVELLYFSGGETKSLAEEGQTITLEDNRDGGFECRVEIDGSEYDPFVQIKIGDIDITYEFTKIPKLNKVNKDGLLEITNVFTYTYKRDNHDIEYNGKTLSCLVQMPEYDMVVRTAVIEVLHAPSLVCGNYQYKLGEKNVQLKCEGRMNPGPSFSTWLWGKKPNRTSLNTGDQIPGFRAYEEPLDNKRFSMILTIDEVTLDLFTKFRLEVENDIGVTEQTLKLIREEETFTYAPEPTQAKPTTNPNPGKDDGKTGADTGVASGRSASVWTLVMSVATIIGATMLSLSTS